MAKGSSTGLVTTFKDAVLKPKGAKPMSAVK